MIDFKTARRYIQDIEALEQKPQPLSEFEQKRLEMMKHEVEKVRDSVQSGHLTITGVLITPSDLDGNGDFVK